MTKQEPERIRILLIISDLDGGGAERQFSMLVENLSQEHFEPHLCFWRPVFKYDRPTDVPVHMVRKSRAWHLPRAIGETRRLIEALRPRLIYSQLHYVNMVTGTALAGSRHRAGWVCRQAADPRREMQGPFAVWARRALGRADRVVGCSEGVRQAVIEHLRVPAERVCTIDNLADVEGIDRRARAPLPIEKSPGVFTVVHAGRLHRQKNQALLLEAFSRFRGRRAELWILGEGPLERRLRRQAAKLGIAGQVRWLGFQSNPFPFFRAADCLALSSDWEGLPNVVIEAMICATPAVSTRCPYGPEELIEDGVDGLLVPVGDAEKLAAALLRLEGRPGTAERLGAAARRRAVERFDPVKICASWESLFASVAR